MVISAFFINIKVEICGHHGSPHYNHHYHVNFIVGSTLSLVVNLSKSSFITSRRHTASPLPIVLLLKGELLRLNQDKFKS